MFMMAYLMDPHRPTESVLNQVSACSAGEGAPPLPLDLMSQGIAMAMGVGVRNAAFDARGRGDMMGNVRAQAGGMSRMQVPVMMVPPMMQGGRR
eukprot:759338-Hanusia_phi.AAC.1